MARLALVVGSVLAAQVVAASAAAGHPVQVDVRSSSPIQAFAFDGNRLAWLSGNYCKTYIRTKLVGQLASRIVGREATLVPTWPETRTMCGDVRFP